MNLSSAVIGIAKLLLTLSAAVVVDGQFTGDPGISFDQPGYAFGSGWELGNIVQDNDNADITQLGGLRFFTGANGSSFLCIVEHAEEEDARVYCMDIQRDAITGHVTSISNTTGSLDIEENGQVSRTSSHLDLGFTLGPDGFDYITFNNDGDNATTKSIAQATWEFDFDTGKPNKLKVGNRFDLSSISYDSVYGLAFSSIAKDPNDAGRPLLFGSGYEELISIPFSSSATVDYDKAEFICQMPGDYSGDMRVISTGNRTNDFLVLDLESQVILILKIDKTTGYPVGYDTTNPTYYATCYDPDTHNNCTTRSNRWDDNYARNPLDCPVEPFLNTSDALPWGMNFDDNTGDLFFTDYASDAFVRIKGFAPGFDVAVVVQALQATINALFGELNNPDLRIRRLADGPGITFVETRRRLDTKATKATKSPKRPGVKGAKGAKGSSEVPAEAPSYTVDDLVASFGTPGNYQVSDEVSESLAFLENTESPAFQAAISGGGSSDEITTTINNIVAAVQGLVDATFSSGTTPPAVVTKVECLECLGTLFEKMADGAEDVDCSTKCQQ